MSQICEQEEQQRDRGRSSSIAMTPAEMREFFDEPVYGDLTPLMACSVHLKKIPFIKADGAFFLALDGQLSGARRTLDGKPVCLLIGEGHSLEEQRGVLVHGTADLIGERATIQRYRDALERKYRDHAEEVPSEKTAVAILKVTPHTLQSWNLNKLHFN